MKRNGQDVVVHKIAAGVFTIAIGTVFEKSWHLASQDGAIVVLVRSNLVLKLLHRDPPK
jgi:hypothetical protein